VKLLRENFLLLTISLGILLAWLFPEPGSSLKDWGMTGPLILWIFFCQGLGLQGKEFRGGSQLLKTIAWGAVVSQVLGPLLGYSAGLFLSGNIDNRVGFILMCCMAPTLVSGTVLAIRAGGDGVTALVLAVGINLLGIATIPINLSWSLGAVVRLNTVGLLLNLVLLVLLPAVGGQVVRQWKPDWPRDHQGIIQHGPVVALGIIVYLSCAPQAGRLRELTLEHLAFLLVPAVAVHLSLLAVGYMGARYLFRIRESGCRSLAIVCSQKTLPIAIATWSIALAQTYPLAVLPALVFHPSQVLCDGVIAAFWGKSGNASAG
jgi:predicted Na+-dependent transporter